MGDAMESPLRIVGPEGPFEITVPANTRLDGDQRIEYARDGLAVWVWCNGYSARFALPEQYAEDTDHESRAPMTGKVVSLPVEIGADVKKGDTVAILEAMKMEYRLEAEADGVVEEIGAKEGELVDLGQLLVRLK